MRIEKYAKRKNEDGTDYIDPITNDFVNELVEVVIIEVPIEQALEEKLKEIDSNTEALIYNGFEYAGLQFSLSTNAQINWSNIPNLPEAVFPLPILSKSDEPYLLQYSDKMNFYLSAVNGKNMHLQSGNVLKQQVLQLKDSESILNFKDDRISA